MPATTRPLFLLAAALALGACATTTVEMRTFKIAGGRAVDLPMTKDGPEPVQNDEIRIDMTGFMLDDVNGELLYTFAFTAKKKSPLRSVTVEDVTGERAEILVIDSAPVISTAGYWRGQAMPRRMGDSTLGWVSDTGDTYKVFRFSIIMGDGRPYIIHQASIWSAEAKPLIREVLGYGGPPRRRVLPADGP